jgi:hypothetical protein
MKMSVHYISHLSKGPQINASDIQPYLETVGIELTSSESQLLQSRVPADGKHFRPHRQLGGPLGMGSM